jgi:hypothetical protein
VGFSLLISGANFTLAYQVLGQQIINKGNLLKLFGSLLQMLPICCCEKWEEYHLTVLSSAKIMYC